MIDWSKSILDELASQAHVPERVEVWGHDKVVRRLRRMMDAPGPLPHILFTGPPGIGKTHLARWIAGEQQLPFYEWMCPIEGKEIPDLGIVLLDECHRETHPEFLFPYMDGRKSVTVTFIGATTRPEKLDPAFASRFVWKIQLDPIDESGLIDMARASGVDAGHAKVFARAAAGNPRQMKTFLSMVEALGTSDPACVLEACEVTADGIDKTDLAILASLQRVRRPLGLVQLATMAGLDKETVRTHDAKLVSMGMIELTPSGRKLTTTGIRYFDAIMETEEQ